MNNDDAIVQLLTEIRDNQRQQLSANEKSRQEHQELQREYMAFYKSTLKGQQCRLGIIGGLIGGGVGWLIYVTMK